jgi:hypothetical protein
MNPLDEIYLSVFQRRIFEKMAIQEGLLQIEQLILPGTVTSPTYINQKDHSKILNYIMLFDSINCFPENLYWDPLLPYGIINEQSMMYSKTKTKAWNNCDEKLKALINKIQYKYFEENKDFIIQYITDNPIIIARNVWDKIGVNIDRIIIKKEYDKLIESIYDDSKYEPPDKYQWLNTIRNEIDEIYSKDLVGFYKAAVNGVFFSSEFMRGNIFDQEEALDIDDSIKFYKVNLSNEIKVLPRPRTINEALEYRNSMQMKQFRGVLLHWFEEFAEGNIAEHKIREKIKKANIELKGLRRYEEFVDSPINFVISSIGGHLPVIGNILTLMGTVGWIYDKWIRKRIGWLLNDE